MEERFVVPGPAVVKVTLVFQGEEGEQFRGTLDEMRRDRPDLAKFFGLMDDSVHGPSASD